MIFEINKTATDGRIFTHHKIFSKSANLSSFAITLIIRSWQSEQDAINESLGYVEFSATIQHADYDSSYLDNLESQVLPLIWQPYSGQYIAPVLPPFNLTEAKAEKRAELASARLKANLTSFTYNAKEYSASQTAQNDLNAIANYASLFNALPAAFPNAWQAIDGTAISIPDVASFKDLYSAMVAQGSANFMHMQTLLYQADQATTQAELEAVAW
jgi:hypothetical protein